MLWQISIIGSKGVDPTTITPTSFMALALKGFSIALAIIGGVAVIYILVAGIQYITAAGNEANQTTAKKTLTYAILGLLLASMAFVLVGEVLRRLNFVGSV